MKRFVLATVTVLALVSSAQAGLILHVPDVVLSQSASSQTGSFIVYLEETAGQDSVVQAYNVGIRQSSQLVNFTGVAMATTPHPALFPGQTPALFSGLGYLAGRDIGVTDTFPQNLALPAQDAPVQNGIQDGLFVVNYTVPANAVGSVTMDVDTVLFALIDKDVNDVPVTIDNGSFTINPVPEPAALGIMILGLPLVLRRRK